MYHKSQNLGPLILGLALVLIGSGSASANSLTITCTGGFPLICPGDAALPAGSSLTGISITISEEISGGSESITNNTAVDFPLSVTETLGSHPVSADLPGTSSTFITPDLTIYDPLSQSGTFAPGATLTLLFPTLMETATSAIDSSDWSDYTAPFFIAFSQTQEGTLTGPGDAPNAGSDATFTTSATVVYDYSAPVPEPSSLALLTMAVVAMGLVRRSAARRAVPGTLSSPMQNTRAEVT